MRRYLVGLGLIALLAPHSSEASGSPDSTSVPRSTSPPAASSMLAPAIEPGSLIRITPRVHADRERIVATYQGIDRDSLSIRSADTGRPPVWSRLALQDIARIDVCRSRSTKLWVGVAVGAAVGLVASVAAISRESEFAPWDAFLYPPIGAVGGALIGGGIASYQWEPAWTPGQGG